MSALRALADLLPVPRIVSTIPGQLTTEYVDALHGQELLDSGHAGATLRTCGGLLRRVQSVDPAVVFGAETTGTLVHGDFGPNNVLLSDDGAEARLLVDWEGCAAGDSVADLARCEFVVRLHHPTMGSSLPELFEGYGAQPHWEARRAAMIEHAQAQLTMARRSAIEANVHTWQQRIDVIATWTDL